jgi:hypothetical protein
MSDLNDLIARNAARAYNEGLERGEAFERQRIVALLEDIMQEFTRKEELERYLAKVKKVLNERV